MSGWLQRNQTLKNENIDLELPDMDIDKYELSERYPDPYMHCKDDCGMECYIELTEDVSWLHGTYSALRWKYQNQSLLDSNKYYVKALVEDTSGERKYHAEFAMGKSKTVAWHIFDIVVTEVLDKKIIGDTNVIQLGPHSTQVNGQWVCGDFDYIYQIVNAGVEI